MRNFISTLIAVAFIASLSAFLASVAIANINDYQITQQTHLESIGE